MSIEARSIAAQAARIDGFIAFGPMKMSGKLRSSKDFWHLSNAFSGLAKGFLRSANDVSSLARDILPIAGDILGLAKDTFRSARDILQISKGFSGLSNGFWDLSKGKTGFPSQKSRFLMFFWGKKLAGGLWAAKTS